MLTKGENQRLLVVSELAAGRLAVEEAATALGVSPRQAWRLLARYRANGAAGMVHGNRGRSPINKCDESLQKQVIKLASEKYLGFNQVHFTEKLALEEQILLSRSTVRRYLASVGIAAPKPQRRTRHRRRRVREAQFGSMLQMDASIHHWLEGRSQPFTLVGAIDDATGYIWAEFRRSEDLLGYFSLLRRILIEQGMPRSVYTDRHVIFLGNKGTVEGQFSKLLSRMGTVQIRASSPQAKGRIERAWKTLQDRLVSELRAEGVSTPGRANQVLQKHLSHHNKHFAVKPRDAQSAWIKPSLDCDLEDLFAFTECRVVRNDNTVRCFGQIFQLGATATQGWAGKRVEVFRRQDGEFRIYLGQLKLPFTQIQEAWVAA